MIATVWANRILGALSPQIQLHTGDPGPNGTAMVAEGVDRRTVNFTRPVNGQVFNADPIAWLNVTRMETFTHFSAWQDGLLFTGTVTAEVVYAGDNVFIDPGALTAFFDCT